MTLLTDFVTGLEAQLEDIIGRVGRLEGAPAAATASDVHDTCQSLQNAIDTLTTRVASLEAVAGTGSA